MQKIPELPSSILEWQAAITSEGLQGAGINDEPLVGACKLSYREFLPLRIIWKHISAEDFDTKMFHLDEWMGRATDVLKDYQSWQTYNKCFYSGFVEGNFGLASVFQTQAREVQSDSFGDKVVFPYDDGTSGPSQTSNLSDDIPPHELEEWAWEEDMSSPLTMDLNTNPRWNRRYLETEFESTIKNALVLFLTALIMPIPDLGVEWAISGKTLRAKFDPGVVEYKAHVDAFLRSKYDEELRVLVDVRETWRLKMLTDIRLQESAQIVAWLMGSPDRRDRQVRILISQDKDEIFLIFAEYGQPYMRYLNSAGHVDVRRSDPESFLTMYEVGPFNTISQPAMSKLGPIILAVVLRENEYLYERWEMDGQGVGPTQILFGDLTTAEIYGPHETADIWAQ